MRKINEENFAKSNDNGQVIIFFSTTVIILITFMAFIINIGVFVKAKINLQNATDASAFAGASVQSRQLTNIAYLNWEMRNIYKEWMFKYYVLGGLNLKGVVSPAGSGTSDFTMDSYGTTATPLQDNYNFPSVCVDFAKTGNVGLCTKYLVPGLPRFQSSNVLGMDETTNAFLDTLVSEKNKDCSLRTSLNFLTANTWAYNIKTVEPTNNISRLAPEIGVDRQGAFPAAFEMALRIRNLEAIVNKAPYTNGVCIRPGSGVKCAVGIEEELSSAPGLSKERINKAFFSGYRNLGNEDDDYMKETFTLKEIAPRPFIDSSFGSLSNLLIPESSNAKSKFYVDLKLMTVNLAMFYTAFAQSATKEGNQSSAGTADSEAECTATKMGLPVPGYPLGFVKNPAVLTYYAVEAKSRFIGMFNPFSNDITLKAYAAAKPMGGRIGPSLFNVTKDSSKVFPRSEASQRKRSSGYISGIDTANIVDRNGDRIGTGKYAPGAPLPLNMGTGPQNFWLSDKSGAIGGWVTGNEIFFGVPNLIYEYPSGNAADDSSSFFAAQEVEIIDPSSPKSMQAGLYNNTILRKFTSNLNGLGDTVTPEDIRKGILAARGPTVYDASNYLVPTPEKYNKEKNLDSYGAIAGAPLDSFTTPGGDFEVYKFELYGPIVSDASSDLIYKNMNEVASVLEVYLKTQEPAIQKYTGSLNIAAANIYAGNVSGGSSGSKLGRQAARIISDIPDTLLENPDDTTSLAAAKPGSCSSIAGKFAFYYLGNDAIGSPSGCGFNPLGETLIQYWNEQKDALQSDYYRGQYAYPLSIKNKLYSAYRPGKTRSAPDDNGTYFDPVSKRTNKMIRNFYSTKFISLNALSPNGAYGKPNFPVMSEGNTGATFTEIQSPQILNLPEFQTIDISSIKL